MASGDGDGATIGRNMRITAIGICLCGIAFGQTPATSVAASPDPVKPLVERLDLDRYKTTIKGLTQFGDRRQGTERNRAAVDWIEAQLKSYGCTNTERITYDFQPVAPTGNQGGGGRAGQAHGFAVKGPQRASITIP